MILIIGIDGLLGNYLYKFLKNHFKVIGTSRKNLGKNIFSFDILNPISDLKIEWAKVDYVIITAACSNVDFCELNPNYSKKVNFEATSKIISELKIKKIPVILFSSEYVFNGEKGNYSEISTKCPNTNYGIQKKNLELYVKSTYKKSTIFRISKIASLNHERSFLFKMKKEMINNQIYYSAIDQFFTPINLEDCGIIILNTIKDNKYGLFNLCGNKNYSRYDLALILKKNFNLKTQLKKCSISEINLTYKVPPNLTMNCDKMKKKFNFIPSELKLI